MIERHAQAVPDLEALLAAVRGCRACEAHLPLGPRPILQASETARILVVGQAPGARVHETGIPWNDPSGERLRAWMGVEKSSMPLKMAAIASTIAVSSAGAVGSS